MNGSKIHLSLLTHLPLIGFAVYAILNGFSDPFFMKIFLSGWIVVVIYQTILTAVYTPPSNSWLSILGLILPVIILVVSAYYRTTDFSVVFIELAVIDLVGVIIGLTFAFIHKAVKDGTKDAPLGAVFITVGIVLTAGFFLSKFLYHFFEIQKFDWILITFILIAVSQSVIFFSSRLSALTNRIGASGKKSHTKESALAAKEISARVILITLGAWFLLIPLTIWIRSLIIPYQ